MKKILFVGAEVMPLAATGGLGDVLGSLPAALKKEYQDDIDIRVVMPLYDAIKPEWRNQMKQEAIINIPLSWRNLYCGVLTNILSFLYLMCGEIKKREKCGHPGPLLRTG